MWRGTRQSEKYLSNMNTNDLTWRDLLVICETAAGMLGRNINEDLMCGYDSPQEFYEELKKELEK